MLIVRQDGEVAMNIDNISCIEVDRMCPVDLIATVPRQFAKSLHYGHERDEFFHRFYLGTFSSEKYAKAVLNTLVAAYERGAKVFRIPEMEREQKC